MCHALKVHILLKPECTWESNNLSCTATVSHGEFESHRNLCSRLRKVKISVVNCCCFLSLRLGTLLHILPIIITLIFTLYILYPSFRGTLCKSFICGINRNLKNCVNGVDDTITCLDVQLNDLGSSLGRSHSHPFAEDVVNRSLDSQ